MTAPKPPLILILPPDISPYREGNRGVDHVHVLESGRPGPRVLVQALTHGNEICGALALNGCSSRVCPGHRAADAGLCQRRGLRRFDPEAPHRRATSTRTSTGCGPTTCCSAPRLGRIAPGARAAALRRRRRSAARHPFDARALPADHGLRHGRQERRYAQQLGVPADLLIDTGHPAGLRMVERGRLRRPGVTEAGAADRMRPALGARSAATWPSTRWCASWR
jgi:hypothetical protein